MAKEGKTQVKPKAGLAIASLILGIVSFIPLVGILLGIIAIGLGIAGLVYINKNNLSGKGFAIAGIILGALGIIFSIALYAALFYFGFVADNGPYAELRVELNKNIMTQNAGILELYKNKYGKYPDTLKQVSDSNYTIYPTDAKMTPFCYKLLTNTSYELKSAGEDKTCDTADDISLDNKKDY